MKIKGKEFTIKQIICLSLYYSIGKNLPAAGKLGGVGKAIRYQLVKNIFKRCGKHVHVEKGACFGSGIDIEIGDYSGIGINANIPGNTIIGDFVMMGPNCHIFGVNHITSDIHKPMCFQGLTHRKQTIIESDVWIGMNVMMTPGRHIKTGTIIGAGCVLTKDFPEYSVIGGNPSKLIKSRIVNSVNSVKI